MNDSSIPQANQGVVKGDVIRFKGLFQWRRVSGQSMVVNALTLTPQSRVLIVGFPQSAVVWSRPTAMLVERNGQVERLPLVDLTHPIQLGLVGLSAVVITMGSFVRFARRKENVSCSIP